MYDDELKRVTRKLNRLIKRGKFDNRKIYLFGVSDNSRQIISILRQNQIEPIAVVDNDVSKQGSYCAMIKVISIDEVERIGAEDKFFIVYSKYWREMMQQYFDYGVCKRNILLLYPKKKSLWKHFIEATVGAALYGNIVGKKQGKHVFVCPYTGTGDIYLIGTFWREYCLRNEIKNYVFVVISSSCQKVAELCGIENIYCVTKQRHISHLIDAYKLWPERFKMKILNDCWDQIHTNQVEWFRGYKGLHFATLFKKYVFALPDYVQPIHPLLTELENDVNNIMKKYKLLEGKTVVISPYSNTLADLPGIFWDTLVNQLKEMGYMVCTNCGSMIEPPIQGTVPVFFSLTVAPQFVQKAGMFIGVRSGLCDVISGCHAKKVILYDKANRFYMGSALEYFSLKDMGLSNDVIECEFFNDNWEQAVGTVIRNISEG